MANSNAGSILALIITVILLGVIAIVGFVAYQIACDVAANTNKKMEKKNMSFSKDGMKVGVKEVSAEQVGDSTQRYRPVSLKSWLHFLIVACSVLMKAWNASSWPAYQSKLGWGQPQAKDTQKRKP